MRRPARAAPGAIGRALGGSAAGVSSAEDGRVAREGEQRVSVAQGRDGTLGAAGGIGILIVPKPAEAGRGDAAGPHLELDSPSSLTHRMALRVNGCGRS